ncbi:unnamed protein product [Ilex paraguariensis]|uniref:Uncharacterized protein n=1 Tax=Ilex paraguariensis TaxID=185542 RepID=A0ABC8SVV1_9AQUA
MRCFNFLHLKLSDSYEEDIVEIGSESDESTDYDTEDESKDDFIDDDLEMYPPSPVPNSGVKIEEIFDDEKPTNENGKRSKKRNNRLSGSEDNNDSQRQIVVKCGTAVPVLESEDEDGFPISSPRMSTDTALNAKANAEEIENKRTGEEVVKKKEKDAPHRTKNLKRKIDAVGQDDEKAR